MGEEIPLDDLSDEEMGEVGSSFAEDKWREQQSLIEELKNEISQLKRQLHFFHTLGKGYNIAPTVGAPADSDDDDGDTMPGLVAHVAYFSNKESLLSRHKIEEYMMEVANSSTDSQMEVDTTGKHFQPCAVELTTGGCQGMCSCDRAVLQVTGSVEYYRGFCLDQLGAPVVQINGELRLPEEGTVVYSQVYTEPFWADKLTLTEEKRLRRMTIKCFNCGEDHHIRDCPEPKDFARINTRRLEYMDSLGTPGTDRRYHVATADDRFAKFVPGVISDKLRQCLGIGREEYPVYIYRMRELGYPPGYRLLECETTLKMYKNSSNDPAPCNNKQSEIREIIFQGFNSMDQKQRTGGTTPNKETAETPLKDDKLAVKEAAKGKEKSEFDDLGSLSDYEFEEGEDGGEVVGFALRKLLKSESSSNEMVTQEEQSLLDSPTEDERSTSTRKQFSLDFPPGLVHDVTECETSPKRWNALRKILDKSNRL